MNNHRKRWKDTISYRRVSTDKQGQSGIGLEVQQAAIESYAHHERFRVVEDFVDAASGRGPKNLLNRPGLKAAIGLAKATRRSIIVASPEAGNLDLCRTFSYGDYRAAPWHPQRLN